MSDLKIHPAWKRILMTEQERTSYLNFICGALWGTLETVRYSGEISDTIKYIISDRLDIIQPLMDKIYEFQAGKEVASADRIREKGE